MSIPPVSSLNIAASIAGTDRAANAGVASTFAKGGGGSNASAIADSIVEQAEKINKSELSGDSDADGRQTLDTFERRRHDEPERDEKDEETLSDGLPPNPDLIVNRPTLGGHIDLCG
jgi:hypothetical protein